MSWFRVDDKSHSNVKVVAAGNAAWGLYVRCGAWSTDQLSDGVIPAAIARLYGTRAEIGALVRAGLWLEQPDGYHMPDFLDYNRSRADVLAERAAAAARQRRGREAQRHANVTDEVTPMSRRDTTVSHGCPDPTRPDPTPTGKSVVDDDPALRPPSSSSDERLAPTIRLIAGAVAAAAAPRNRRAFIASTAAKILAEHGAEISARLGAGETAHDLATSWTGSTCYADIALRELGRPTLGLVGGGA